MACRTNGSTSRGSGSRGPHRGRSVGASRSRAPCVQQNLVKFVAGISKDAARCGSHPSTPRKSTIPPSHTATDHYGQVKHNTSPHHEVAAVGVNSVVRQSALSAPLLSHKPGHPYPSQIPLSLSPMGGQHKHISGIAIVHQPVPLTPLVVKPSSRNSSPASHGCCSVRTPTTNTTQASSCQSSPGIPATTFIWKEVCQPTSGAQPPYLPRTSTPPPPSTPPAKEVSPKRFTPSPPLPPPPPALHHNSGSVASFAAIRPSEVTVSPAASPTEAACGQHHSSPLDTELPRFGLAARDLEKEFCKEAAKEVAQLVAGTPATIRTQFVPGQTSAIQLTRNVCAGLRVATWARARDVAESLLCSARCGCQSTSRSSSEPPHLERLCALRRARNKAQANRQLVTLIALRSELLTRTALEAWRNLLVYQRHSRSLQSLSATMGTKARQWIEAKKSRTLVRQCISAWMLVHVRAHSARTQYELDSVAVGVDEVRDTFRDSLGKQLVRSQQRFLLKRLFSEWGRHTWRDWWKAAWAKLEEEQAKRLVLQQRCNGLIGAFLLRELACLIFSSWRRQLQRCHRRFNLTSRLGDEWCAIEVKRLTNLLNTTLWHRAFSAWRLCAQTHWREHAREQLLLLRGEFHHRVKHFISKTQKHELMGETFRCWRSGITILGAGEKLKEVAMRLGDTLTTLAGIGETSHVFRLLANAWTVWLCLVKPELSRHRGLPPWAFSGSDCSRHFWASESEEARRAYDAGFLSRSSTALDVAKASAPSSSPSVATLPPCIPSTMQERRDIKDEACAPACPGTPTVPCRSHPCSPARVAYSNGSSLESSLGLSLDSIKSGGLSCEAPSPPGVVLR